MINPKGDDPKAGRRFVPTARQITKHRMRANAAVHETMPDAPPPSPPGAEFETRSPGIGLKNKEALKTIRGR